MTKQKIRCPDCGARASATDASCPRCSMTFSVLCECGAAHHLADDACPECGAEPMVAEFKRPIGRGRIFAGVVLLLLFVGVGAAIWNARTRHAKKAVVWRLRDAAFEAARDGRYEEALPLLEQVVIARPRDAEMWYLRAIAERETGRPSSRFIASAESALEIDALFSEAATLIAVAYLQDGEPARALSFARAGVEGARPTAYACRVLADAEMRQARPDIGRAIAALTRARSLGDADPELRISVALLEVRRLSGVPAELYPQRVSQVIERAADTIGGLEPRAAGEPRMQLAAAELALARGELALARRYCAALLDKEAFRRDTLQLERALQILGRAEIRAGEPESGLVHLAEAIDVRPTAGVAGDVAGFLIASGYARRAAEILEEAIEAVEAADGRDDLYASLGRVYLATGRVDDAEAALARVPPGLDALRLRGDLLMLRGSWEAAEAAFSEATDAAPDRSWPRLRRARLALIRPGTDAERRRRAADALADLERGAGTPWAAEPGYLETVGELQAAAGRRDEAERSLRAAIDTHPYSALAHLALARVLLRPGAEAQVDEVVRLLAAAAAIAPHDEAVVLDVGRMSLALGAANQVVTISDRLLRRDPQNVNVLARQAEAYRALGMWGESAACLETAIGVATADGELWTAYVDSLLRAGRREDARAAVERAAAAGADRGRLELVVAMRSGDDAAAIEALRARGPTTHLATYLLSAGRVDEALAVLDEVLGREPGDAFARRLLVLALLDADPESPIAPERVSRARAVVEGAPVALPPGVRELLDGRIAMAEGALDTAIDRLTGAAAERPLDADAHFYLGQALYRGGRRVEGLQSLRRAVQLPGANPSFEWLLSRCLLLVADSAESGARREALLWEAVQHDSANVPATAALCDLLFERGAFADCAKLSSRIVLVAAMDPADAVQFRRLARAAGLHTVGLGALTAHLDTLPAEGDPQWERRVVDALVLAGAGRNGEAVVALAEVLGTPGETAIVVACYLECLIRDGQHLVAAERLNALADEGRLPAWAQLEIASSFVRAGRSELAIAVVDGLLERRPDDLDVVRTGVAARLRSGDGEGALALLDKAESRAAAGAPRDALRVVRASALRTLGRFAEAERLAREVAAAGTLEGELEAEARLVIAETLVESGDMVAGPEAASEAADAVGGLVTAPVALVARVRFLESAVALREGRWEDAEQALEASVALNPADHAAANNLAFLLSMRPTEARRALALAESATDAMPEAAEYWDTRARCERTDGRVEDAERSWREALRLYLERRPVPLAACAESEVGLAELLAETDRWKESRVLAKRALQRDPGAEVTRRARALLRVP